MKAQSRCDIAFRGFFFFFFFFFFEGERVDLTMLIYDFDILITFACK